MLDILIWVLTVEILGLAALPLLRSFFDNRRDAALLSRPLGLALVAWGGWLIAVVATGRFNRLGLLVAMAALGALSWRAHRRSAPGKKDRPSFWGPEEKRAAVFFWACAAVFFLLRAGFPEIFGQEKYMDLAFLNSLTRNTAMPPLDPWMAGRTINYYYWGYLLSSVLTKISGVPTPISYNLAIGTFGAYSFVSAVCLGLRLSGGRRAAGTWAGIATVFGANVVGAFDALRAPFGRGFDYWHASRVIASGDTINEFPFFTFLQADLHPHLTAFPFFVASFAVAHRFVELPRVAAEKGARERALAILPPALLLLLTAGTSRAANNWNLPALALLFVFVGILRWRGERPWPSPVAALRGVLFGGGLLLAMLVAWVFYSRSYALPQPAIEMTTMKSDLIEFLGVWGFFFLVAILVLLPGKPADEPARRRRDLGLSAVAAAALLVGLAEKTPALVALGPLIVLAGMFGWKAAKRGSDGSSDVFLSFLLLLGLAMIAGCEFVYFKDSYGAQLQRMNTIFKFYHQAWPLLAIPLAVLAERTWTSAGRGSWKRGVLAAGAVLMLLYPADALMWRIRQAPDGLTVNAWPALVRRGPGDAAAIRWLSTNAQRSAVVMEATGDAYSEYARIATHTGIPTVLGWANHEGLWRADDKEIPERIALIRAFYSAPDARTALSVVQKYGVTHVVVGDLERRAYPNPNAVATYGFLQPVLSGPTTVYRVFGAP